MITAWISFVIESEQSVFLIPLMSCIFHFLYKHRRSDLLNQHKVIERVHRDVFTLHQCYAVLYVWFDGNNFWSYGSHVHIDTGLLVCYYKVTIFEEPCALIYSWLFYHWMLSLCRPRAHLSQCSHSHRGTCTNSLFLQAKFLEIYAKQVIGSRSTPPPHVLVSTLVIRSWIVLYMHTYCCGVVVYVYHIHVHRYSNDNHTKLQATCGCITKPVS